ncbi:hypothetical protein HMI56_007470 [Coelomomyces lativittatus]|nr:hypothetical protein HMI56_007470 [Coelomomyces lativittatus]
MCVLQDFEAITPNVLARTIETVQGGGCIVLLLKTLTSLKQFYTMVMDVHARYRTESHQAVTPRFNERFLLSLSSCPMCLMVDDEFNVLPLSLSKTIPATLPLNVEKTLTSQEKELSALKVSLKEDEKVGPLIEKCVTVDQAKAVLMFMDVMAEKPSTLSHANTTMVALTASRGRGKSASIGLALAAAIGYGYRSILVTSPTPENVSTLFTFVMKGLQGMGYAPHLDYEVIHAGTPSSTSTLSTPSTKRVTSLAIPCVVQINVYKTHRQTIRYATPHDVHHMTSSMEILVIDEAAAIPLPIVKQWTFPALVFLASTVHGYEGTGRSLSLKFIESFKYSARPPPSSSSSSTHMDASSTSSLTRRSSMHVPTSSSSPSSSTSSSSSVGNFKEITLTQPIRYAMDDPVEQWLNQVLCLNATSIPNTPSPSTSSLGYPHPSDCQLYYVSRDTLFSFHPISEHFLQKMMGLYVASHYKNTPNDLQLMSDAPAHHLFVLLGPQSTPRTSSTTSSFMKEKPPSPPFVPEPLVVLQVSLEGKISKTSIELALLRGQGPEGDLIPWCMSQQFQDPNFAMLSGARIVRIATHPDYLGFGYGSRALQLLEQYYRGDLDLTERTSSSSVPLSSKDTAPLSSTSMKGDVSDPFPLPLSTSKKTDVVMAKEEVLGVRPTSTLPPLLVHLTLRRPEPLDWLGVSFGLTSRLFRFWQRQGFFPVYVRQTPHEMTGEHTCIVLKSLDVLPTTHRSSEALHPVHTQPQAQPQNSHPFITMHPTPSSTQSWVTSFSLDFCHRWIYLLGYEFRSFPSVLAVTLFTCAFQHQTFSSSSSSSTTTTTATLATTSSSSFSSLTLKEVLMHFTYHDLKRLQGYTHQGMDYHVILDLVPRLARLYFTPGLFMHPDLKFTGLQHSLLLGLGLQYKSMEQMAHEFHLPVSQVMALFLKSMKRYEYHLNQLVLRQVETQ